MGIICKDDKKRKVTLQELQRIIDDLLARKKYLENICGELYYQNDDNGKPTCIKEYQLEIDKLTKEVEKLEIIYNLWENKNIEIKFFYEEQIYIINVNRETKLGDAFKNALLNNKFQGVRYTKNMDSETRYTDENFKNTEQFNYEQMEFLLRGENITEYFRNNKPVPSLVKDPNSSPISILVYVPCSTKIMLNTNYN